MSGPTEMTRTRIADAIEHTFDGRSPAPVQLAAAARERGDLEVAELMGRLDAPRYARLADLWSDLPGLPIDA